MNPLLLIHGGGLADWFTPLAAEPALAHRPIIRMVRAGYPGADDTAPPGLTVRDHADRAAARLHSPADVVAHSSGCAIALQLALDHPELVRTLVLCEPPLLDTLADPADLDLLRESFGPAIGAAMAATARGDAPAAFDAFMTLVCGPDHRAVMDKTLGATLVDDAVAGSSYFFTDELPAVGAWTFTPAEAARVHQRVLLIQGSASPPPLHRLNAHLAAQLTRATVTTLEGANHLMPLTAPADLARLITAFTE